MNKVILIGPEVGRGGGTRVSFREHIELCRYQGLNHVVVSTTSLNNNEGRFKIFFRVMSVTSKSISGGDLIFLQASPEA